MKKLLDIILSVGAITILIVGGWTTRPFQYHVFLHWYIFLYSIYLIFRTKAFTGKFGVIIFSGSAIIFNPFIFFTFSRTVWSIIDFVLILIGFSVLTWRILVYIESLSKKGKLVFKLFQHYFVFFIIIFLLFGLFFFDGGMKIGVVKPFHNFMLITRASIAKGFIVASDESKVEEEQYREPSEKITGIKIEYVFTTKNGRTIKDSTIVSIKKPKYFANVNVKPIPIEVEYVLSNPKINIIKGQITHQSLITGFVIYIVCVVLLVVVFVPLGILLIKDFLRRINEIKNEITIVDNK